VHVVVDQAVHHQQGSHLEHRAGYFFYVLGVCFRQVVVAMLAGSAAVLAHRKYSADDPAVMALQSLLRDTVGHWRIVRTTAEQWDPQKGCSRFG
jgi:hypothetical protein